MRVVAGPNGSGKSTLLHDLSTHFPLGYVLNPDLVEKELWHTGQLSFKKWGLQVRPGDFLRFLAEHPLASGYSASGVVIQRNILRVSSGASAGYFTAILADFMRRRWLDNRQSFTFETVMSSVDKVRLLHHANEAGYRTYLYFICTDSPLINMQRVAVRVQQGGHDVPEGKIAARYERSLSLLQDAVKESSRAFIFENSGSTYRLIAEFENNKLISVANDPPRWYVLAMRR